MPLVCYVGCGLTVFPGYVVAESCGEESRVRTTVITDVFFIVIFTLAVKVVLNVLDGYVRTEASDTSCILSVILRSIGEERIGCEFASLDGDGFSAYSIGFHRGNLVKVVHKGSIGVKVSVLIYYDAFSLI